jgi:hypothetical protein
MINQMLKEFSHFRLRLPRPHLRARACVSRLLSAIAAIHTLLKRTFCF